MQKRSWKNFNQTIFQSKLSEVDWTQFFNTDNLDLKKHIFEEKISDILNRIAPMKFVQKRKNHRNWVDTELQKLMSDRDEQKNLARQLKNDAEWKKYRFLRNSCTKMLKTKKNDYMSTLYNTYQEKKDVSSIFRTTKELLGWANAGQPSCLVVGVNL